MTANAARLLVVLLVTAPAPCVSAGAQTRPDPAPQQQVSQAAPDQAAIDIARIRRLLREMQTAASESRLPGLAPMVTVEITPPPIKTEDATGMLRFEETIWVAGLAWENPTLNELLAAYVKQSDFPYVYAPSLQELSARVPGLQYLHPVNAVMAANKAIRGAVNRHKAEKARREVAAELRALKAHNAAVAAESKPAKKQQ